MAPRLWLDATEPDDMPTSVLLPGREPAMAATAAKMNAAPPVPPLPSSPPFIPPRNNSSTAETRRRSHQANQSRKKATLPSQTPPAPEVISNLIDSLANISFPDPTGAGSGSNSKQSSKHPTPNIQQANSFENSKVNVGGTISTPGSGRVIQLPMRSSSASATEFDVLKDHLSMNLHELIDDAAEPPVVRTVKPRATPLSNGRSKIREGYGLGLFGAERHSNSSLVSLGSSNGNDESRGGLGGLLSRRRNSLRSPSEGSFSYSDYEGQKSPVSPRSPVKGGFGIGTKPASKSDRRRDSVGRTSGMQSPKKASLVAVQEHPSPKFTDENGLGNGFTPPVKEYSKPTSVSAKKEGKKPRQSPKPPSVAVLSGPYVPDRRSSLIRTEASPSLDVPKTRSPSVSPRMTNGSLKPKKNEQRPEPKTLTSHSSFDLLNGEDTEVTKRIKELKAKKEQRDREAREASLSPSPSPGALDLRVNGYSGTSNHVYSNASSHLSNPRRNRRPQDIKVPASKDDKETSYLRSGNASSRSPDPDLDEPTTPLTPTPLPINYSFVVKSLDDDRPESQHSNSSPDVPKNTWRRSMGSRSLFAGTSSKKDGSHDDRSRGSMDNQNRKGTSRRSTSLPRSKRWSDSGLERQSSLMADGSNSKSVNRSSTVPEEASPSPAPIDPVVQAVEDFMSAKRLSQTVRHPLSGRLVSFSEVGSPKGHTVFCCVGMGLTRFVTAFYDELAYTLNLRIITPDRPGIGDSEADPIGTPLSWPDDIILICQHLKITKFSILAHSAGAIYALATALRIPQHIRGKVHLLAPWIPPSQMAPIGVNTDPPPAAQLPRGQRILRALPAQFLKVANSSLLSATSASLSPKVGMPGNAGTGSTRKSTKRKGANKSPDAILEANMRRESILLMDQQTMPSEALSIARATSTQNLRAAAASHASSPRPTTSSGAGQNLSVPNSHSRSISTPLTPTLHPSLSQLLKTPDDQAQYDELLTMRIWAAATTRANPAVDLVVCLEHSTPIGFRYVDITRAIVVHHGTKDTRVPVENVKWLSGQMKRCELRVLDGETHGLMASAGVMGGVLTEMAAEWEEWDKVVRRGRG